MRLTAVNTPLETCIASHAEGCLTKVEPAKWKGVPKIAPWGGQELHTHRALTVTTLQHRVERGRVQGLYFLAIAGYAICCNL